MSTTRPNILVVQADQLRLDCLGLSGRYPVQTPNLDKLAEEGIFFTDAYTSIPLCCPSRQSFLHGRRAEAFGALWNFDQSIPVRHLEPGDYVWPRELQEHGYQTGHVGKWHIHPQLGPSAFGFDDAVSDAEYNSFRRGKYPGVAFTNGFFGEIDPVAREDAYTHWMTERTVEMIGKYSAANKPWLISLDFHEPHLPCRPVQEFASRYAADDIPMWGSFNESFLNKPYIQKQQLRSWGIESFTWDDWAPIVARYYAVVTQLDDAVGRLLRALDREGVREQTIVIFTADHGDMCGGHRMMDKHYVMYDDVVRVPLLIRWPGRVKPGTVCGDFVTNGLDLPPTLLEACGLKAKPFFHGRSLMPLLEGRAPDDWRQAAVVTYNGQQFGLYTQRMIRTKTHKYVWNHTDIDELYDLEQDPDELHNLIGQADLQEEASRLKRMLFDELAAVQDPFINSFTGRQLLGSN